MQILKLYDFNLKKIIILVLICVYKVNSFPNFEKSNEIETSSVTKSSENDKNNNNNEPSPSLFINDEKNAIKINHNNDNYLVEYAKNMKNYLNTSIDPCDDFYEYACGNWEKYHSRPEGVHKFTVFKTMEIDIAEKIRNLLKEIDDTNNTDSDYAKNAKIYYKSCLSRNGVEPLLEYFDTVLGGWPALNENWNNDTGLDWMNLTISTNIFASALIEVYYTVDMKNALERAMYIDEPQLGLINANYYIDESKSDKITAYKNLIIECLTILGASKDISLATAEEIIELEKKLAKVMRDPNERIDDEDEYHEVTIGELMSNYSDVNWKRLIEMYLRKSVELNQTVVVCRPEFIGPFTELISNTNIRVITNYICWRITFDIVLSLDKRFENAFINFKRELYGTNVILPYWYECVGETMVVAQRSVTTMFIRKYFNETSRDGLIELTENLKYSFLEIIKESDWLDDEIKELAIKKLNYTRLELGYPDSYLKFNQSFDDELDFKEDEYFNNFWQYKLSQSFHGIDELITSKLLDAWQIVSPLSVDAYHVKVTNQIVFPTGILQPPMYHPDFPEAIKFGIIGSYIGHELTHGFDDIGRKYDYLGRMNDWWNDNSAKNFIERAKCYIEQYNSYKIQGHNINGELSLGENIADNGGIMQSLRAYKNWLLQHDNYDEINLPGIDLNESQLFFLSYAQSWCSSITPESMEISLADDKHAPGNIRMIGAVRNVPEFAEVFNCPIGSFMNPVKRCKLW